MQFSRGVAAIPACDPQSLLIHRWLPARQPPAWPCTSPAPSAARWVRCVGASDMHGLPVVLPQSMHVHTCVTAVEDSNKLALRLFVGCRPAPPPLEPPPPPPAPLPKSTVLSFVIQPKKNSSRGSDGSSGSAAPPPPAAPPLAQLRTNLVAAVQAAAVAAGARNPPLVTVQDAPASGDVGSPEGLEFSVEFAGGAGGQLMAQRLGASLLAQPQAVLPSERFGEVEVSGMRLNGAVVDPPRKWDTPTWLVFVAAALAGSATVVLGERRRAWPWLGCIKRTGILPTTSCSRLWHTGSSTFICSSMSLRFKGHVLLRLPG